MKRLSGIFAALSMVLLCSCASTVYVPMKVEHPAEVNMSAYRQVAIAGIKGNNGRAVEDRIKPLLLESGRFKVLDRTRMDQIWQELDISESDISDPGQRVKLGKFLSASAIIAGHIDGVYKEKITSRESTCKQDKQEYPCTIYTREGVLKSEGNIDVIDVETGEILMSKRLECARSAQKSATDAEPDRIDRDALISRCAAQNASVFVKAVSPWSEYVRVPFEKDGKIPELEKGIAQATVGNTNEAIGTFKACIKNYEANPKTKPESLAKIYWNMGLVYEYTGQFERASASLKKAYEISREQRFLAELQNVERLKEDSLRLAEQNRLE